VKRNDVERFEAQAEHLLSLAVTLCEQELAHNKEAPNEFQCALCASSLSIQESIKAFLAIIRTLPST